MLIGVISDIHDNAHNLVIALKLAQQRGAEQLLCLGDLMNGGIAKTLAGCGIPVHAIRGNNDGELVEITRASMTKGSGMYFSSKMHDAVEFGGKRIFLAHFPEIARPIAKSGDFDAVFYGHNHKKQQEMVGACLLLNPGEISAHKTGGASMAFYDTSTNTAEIVDLQDTLTHKSELVSEYRKNLPEHFKPRKDR